MNLKVLVIDDSSVMRKMVMQALSDTKLAEFEFTEAADGADGLTKFRADTFHVAFIDWNMPNMTGIDFVREVRKLPKSDNTVLVMVTSEKASSKIDEAVNHAGADGYIGKPFTKDDFAAKLKRLLPRIGVDV